MVVVAERERERERDVRISYKTHAPPDPCTQALFLPSLSAPHAGGTTGLRFAMSNSGAEKLVIYGPPGTSAITAAASRKCITWAHQILSLFVSNDAGFFFCIPLQLS